MLEIGSPIPSVTLFDDTGKNVNLSDFAGKYIVLYAYPRNDTPGCTAEACSFRDQSQEITATGAVILGLSPDSVKSHQKFKAKYQLNFSLLSDPNHELLEILGAWGEKVRFGKTSFGVIRSTFIFDPTGKLIKIWPKVSPQSHGEEIAAFLKKV
ncbi:MAG: peroxiredoxin [Sphaerochaetaceae bacterium]|jgi:peroxiredoxin Q/BCP|nr:peroxiredoxin [Sphaerochaetaceae bacterium]MDD3365691.1 peroxiredoxin [Sphaerochaetaceae bacterium]MDD4218863.1 peroxiredoxin [Sphaerochaetaceae bacterium]MDY0371291.1 peroxiredoxin [Sphaerochaetaceae bacterium]